MEGSIKCFVDSPQISMAPSSQGDDDRQGHTQSSISRDSAAKDGNAKLSKSKNTNGDNASPEWYDEFAIGWNEIFDQEPISASTQSAVQEEVSAPSGVGSSLPSQLQSNERTKSIQRSEQKDGAVNAVGFVPEAGQSKKPPPYLRIVVGKKNAIERSMKEHLLVCPTKQIRKPSEVMEGELDQLRAQLGQAHREKRREARQMRRLGRKCRVKASECLEELEELHLPSGRLEPISNEDGTLLTARGPTRKLDTKSFFMHLGKQTCGLRGEGPNAEGPLTAR
eukprot:TRINITY_DN35172_c0_g1_i1.p1 TRINITY_DN35172_c0_g1~~TRINITY_DN35172_c0_g1_i1.p1  ORF type:complete len:280 (-),score=48.26 TRINITY_DN35172_c0_g1_i1:61-900(-)